MTKLTGLTELGGVDPTDLLYAVDNSATPTEYKIEAKNVLRSNLIGYRTFNGSANLTTTSTTWTPVDGTNLAYITVDLEIGDTIWCYFQGSAQHSTTNYTRFDFEIDRPTSGNLIMAETFMGASANAGEGLFQIYNTTGQNFSGCFPYTATEAGLHGFRPVWRVASGTGTLYCGSTNQDYPPVFKVMWS